MQSKEQNAKESDIWRDLWNLATGSIGIGIQLQRKCGLNTIAQPSPPCVFDTKRKKININLSLSVTRGFRVWPFHLTVFVNDSLFQGFPVNLLIFHLVTCFEIMKIKSLQFFRGLRISQQSTYI